MRNKKGPAWVLSFWWRGEDYQGLLPCSSMEAALIIMLAYGSTAVSSIQPPKRKAPACAEAFFL